MMVPEPGLRARLFFLSKPLSKSIPEESSSKSGANSSQTAVDCGPLMESIVTKFVTSGSNSALIDFGRDAVNHSFC